jgi:hypothetical protein
MKLLNIQFPLTPSHFLSLRIKHSFQHPLLKQLQGMFHPYKTTSIITFLCYFTFCIFRQQTRRCRVVNSTVQISVRNVTWRLLPQSNFCSTHHRTFPLYGASPSETIRQNRVNSIGVEIRETRIQEKLSYIALHVLRDDNLYTMIQYFVLTPPTASLTRLLFKSSWKIINDFKWNKSKN